MQRDTSLLDGHQVIAVAPEMANLRGLDMFHVCLCLARDHKARERCFDQP